MDDRQQEDEQEHGQDGSDDAKNEARDGHAAAILTRLADLTERHCAEHDGGDASERPGDHLPDRAAQSGDSKRVRSPTCQLRPSGAGLHIGTLLAVGRLPARCWPNWPGPGWAC